MGKIDAYDTEKSSNSARSSNEYLPKERIPQEGFSKEEGRIEGVSSDLKETEKPQVDLKDKNQASDVEEISQDFTAQRSIHEGVYTGRRRFGKWRNLIMMVGLLFAIISLSLVGYMYLLR